MGFPFCFRRDEKTEERSSSFFSREIFGVRHVGPQFPPHYERKGIDRVYYRVIERTGGWETGWVK